MGEYFVYMMSSPSRTLYVGVTNERERRVEEHRSKQVASFTRRYNVTRLVCYEATSDVFTAIAREKQIKGWLRAKKVALIKSVNPAWQDLSAAWYTEDRDSSLRSE